MAAPKRSARKGGSSRAKQGPAPAGWLEWVASATGLVLALALIGYVVWTGVTGSDGPPTVNIELERITEAGDGYVAAIVATNPTTATAASVTVAGELKRDGQVIETSRTEFGYVPGKARRQGGLYFRQDPRQFELELRAEGFSRP